MAAMLTGSEAGTQSKSCHTVVFTCNSRLKGIMKSAYRYYTSRHYDAR